MIQTLFDFPVALGWVHGVVHDAIDRARPINARPDLSAIRAAALDEIYHNGAPVLAVVIIPSTYCCLLSREEHRDAAT
jgi:hypothetical protein